MNDRFPSDVSERPISMTFKSSTFSLEREVKGGLVTQSIDSEPIESIDCITRHHKISVSKFKYLSHRILIVILSFIATKSSIYELGLISKDWLTATKSERLRYFRFNQRIILDLKNMVEKVWSSTCTRTLMKPNQDIEFYLFSKPQVHLFAYTITRYESIKKDQLNEIFRLTFPEYYFSISEKVTCRRCLLFKDFYLNGYEGAISGPQTQIRLNVEKMLRLVLRDLKEKIRLAKRSALLGFIVEPNCCCWC